MKNNRFPLLFGLIGIAFLIVQTFFVLFISLQVFEPALDFRAAYTLHSQIRHSILLAGCVFLFTGYLLSFRANRQIKKRVALFGLTAVIIALIALGLTVYFYLNALTPDNFEAQKAVVTFYSAAVSTFLIAWLTQLFGRKLEPAKTLLTVIPMLITAVCAAFVITTSKVNLLVHIPEPAGRTLRIIFFIIGVLSGIFYLVFRIREKSEKEVILYEQCLFASVFYPILFMLRF